jgi:phosphoribosylaminoimidazolecarboxamide formyltransferase/IMP cyclohydrolase
VTVRRALLSVADKTDLADFARRLVGLGFEVVSTGGTRNALENSGVPVTGVSQVTGFPEILDGRVKTLHPKIHAGILARREDANHRAALAEQGITGIDLVVVNLYPFERTVAQPDVGFGEAIENIDIGGPAMVRAAAKNHEHVLVVVDPADYDTVAEALERSAATGEAVASALRRRLAHKAFDHTARYDRAIADWFAARESAQPGPFPPRVALSLTRDEVLRYGENPHQAGALYRLDGGAGPLGGYRQAQGKELSWNNLLDADAARKLVALFTEPAVVLVKHNNPCGVGRGSDLAEAYGRAFACDPVSAFGSIVAVNRAVDEAFLAALADLFVEVLLAPDYTAAALERLAGKRNLRVLRTPPYAPAAGALEWRAVDGGFLAQPPDAQAEDATSWTCASRRRPSGLETQALEFAWKVARYVKSNAIVLTQPHQTVGIGAGQMSRVDSCRLAIQKAQLPVAGTVAASDAFFPFRDGIDVLAAAGVTAVVHPGGSKRDDETVAAADEHGLAVLLTGTRHFRH